MSYTSAMNAVLRGLAAVKASRDAAIASFRDGMAVVPDAGLDPADAEALNNATNRFVADVRRVIENGRNLMTPLLTRLAREIGYSPGVSDLTGFFRAHRVHMVGLTDYVAPRGIAIGANPSTGTLRRLTVDHLGKTIESGRHNQIITAKIESRLSSESLTAILRGGPAAIDALDYLAGSGDQTASLDMFTAANPGSLITNQTLRGNPETDDADPVTVVTDWDLSDVSGSPTHLIETSPVWDGLDYVHNIGVASTTRRFHRNLSGAFLQNPYTPVLPFVIARRAGAWEGSVDITWGGKTQSFAHGVISTSAWTPLVVDRDADLYPVNFDAASAVYRVDVISGAGAGANRILIAAIGMREMVQFQEWWYAWIRGDNDDYPLGSLFSFLDGLAPTGDINDTLGFLYDDQNVGGYLPSAGTNLVSPAAPAPEAAMFSSSVSAVEGSDALADAGTHATGVQAAASTFVAVYNISNTGTGVLRIDTPVIVATDIVSKGGSALLTRLPTQRAIRPGGSTTFDVTVVYPTTGLTGTATVSIANNDANENPYNFTISAESS